MTLIEREETDWLRGRNVKVREHFEFGDWPPPGTSQGPSWIQKFLFSLLWNEKNASQMSSGTSNPSSEQELTLIRKILFSDEGPVNKNVKMIFSPEFNLSSGEVVPIGGVLLAGNSPTGPNLFDFDDNKIIPNVQEKPAEDWNVLSYHRLIFQYAFKVTRFKILIIELQWLSDDVYNSVDSDSGHDPACAYHCLPPLPQKQVTGRKYYPGRRRTKTIRFKGRSSCHLSRRTRNQPNTNK